MIWETGSCGCRTCGHCRGRAPDPAGINSARPGIFRGKRVPYPLRAVRRTLLRLEIEVRFRQRLGKGVAGGLGFDHRTWGGAFDGGTDGVTPEFRRVGLHELLGDMDGMQQGLSEVGEGGGGVGVVDLSLRGGGEEQGRGGA